MEAKADAARRQLERMKGLVARGAVEQKLADEAEAAARVAEAELESKKAEVAEAELRLTQAKRRIEATPIDRTANRSVASSTPADLRDAVELLEVQLQAKQAELRGPRRRPISNVASSIGSRAWTPAERWNLSWWTSRRSGSASRKPGSSRRRPRSPRAELRLTQAKRRIEATPIDRTVNRSAAPSTLANLRDAVEVMEAQLQGKEAELRGAELKVAQAKTQLDPMKADGLELQPLFRRCEGRSRGGHQPNSTRRRPRSRNSRSGSSRRNVGPRPRTPGSSARSNRARAGLDRMESLTKQGAVPIRQLEAARARFDELMFQLDPKYVPDPGRK